MRVLEWSVDLSHRGGPGTGRTRDGEDRVSGRGSPPTDVGDKVWHADRRPCTVKKGVV